MNKGIFHAHNSKIGLRIRKVMYAPNRSGNSSEVYRAETSEDAPIESGWQSGTFYGVTLLQFNNDTHAYIVLYHRDNVNHEDECCDVVEAVYEYNSWTAAQHEFSNWELLHIYSKNLNYYPQGYGSVEHDNGDDDDEDF